MAITQSQDLPEKDGKFFPALPIEAATILYAGSIAAANPAGNVVPAADTAGLHVLGRAEENPDGSSGDYDNSAGAAGDLNALVKRGAFIVNNSVGDPVVAGDINKFIYIEDAATVNHTGGVNKVVAGRFLGFFNNDATRCIVDFVQRPNSENALP